MFRFTLVCPSCGTVHDETGEKRIPQPIYVCEMCHETGLKVIKVETANPKT